MIPPVPISLRLAIGCGLMAIAHAFASAANWMVPEMDQEERR